MNMICIVLGATFLAVGVAFQLGIAPRWIKTLREMPEEERRGIRMDRLCKNVACVFLSVGAIFALCGFSTVFKEAAFLWCMIAWLVLTGLDVAFITKSNRYKTGL